MESLQVCLACYRYTCVHASWFYFREHTRDVSGSDKPIYVVKIIEDRGVLHCV